MKKQFNLLLAILLSLSLFGCSNASSDDQTNIDKQDMIDATGMDIDAPEGAKDVQYNVIESDDEHPVAEVTFTYDDIDYSYRAQSTGLLKLYDSNDDLSSAVDLANDLSGIDDEWENSTVQSVSYCDAVLLTSDQNEVVIWLDAVVGVQYSLSTSENDEDIVEFANTIFVSMQGDSDGTEENQSFEGKYESDDTSTVELTYGGMSVYDVNISIYRLCVLTGEGRYEDGKLTLQLIDPNDNDMEGQFYKEDDDTYTIKITKSSWNYLPKGETITGFKMK